MSTLLEKPAPAPTALAPVVLQSRHQWLHWRGVLIAGIVGLAATLLALWLVPGSWHTDHLNWLAELWGAGLFLTIVAVVVAYLMAPGSILATAQKLDTRYAAKNRLEAIASLKDPNSPLAQALRAETARYLERETEARPARALPWLVAALIALILAHLISLAIWLLPVLRPASKLTPPPPQQQQAQQPPDAKETPKASIDWKTPESEIMANPVEQVPIDAAINSTTGLQNLTLQISVNGELKKSVPLPDQTPGDHEIKSSISLDDLKVKPFDVVSYYVQAKSDPTEKAPDTTSSLQIIQVSPFRDQVKGDPSSPGSVKKPNELLAQLQLAQLRAVQDNFALAHSDQLPTDPTRQQEDAQVAKEQSDLSAKTEDVIKSLTADGSPASDIDQLHQAEPLMNDAGKQIAAAQNEAALTPQQKALNLIAAVEKASLDEPSKDAQTPPASDANDAFPDAPKPPALPHEQTASGELEALAKHQTDLAQDLGKDSDSTPAQATATAQPTPEPTPAPTPVPSPAPAANGAPNTPPNTTPNNPATSPSPASAANGAPNSPQAAASNNPPASPPATPDANANGAPPPNATATSAPAPTPVPTPPPIDPFSPDAEKGTIAERETRILQGIDTLQSANKDLPPKVSDALNSAQTNANEAMKDLAADQGAAALEPAATAARDLQQAVTSMQAADAEATRKALAEAQQQLNDQATQLRGMAQQKPAPAPAAAGPQLMAVAQEVHAVETGLQTTANQEEQAGSPQTAQPLDHLAQQIQDQKVAPDLAAMSKSGLDANQANALADKLEATAVQAAQGMVPAQPTAQDYAGLADALERSRANLDHLAENAGGSPADMSTTASGSPAGDHSDAGNPPASGDQPGQTSAQSPSQASGQTPASGSPNSTSSTASSAQTPGGMSNANAPASGNSSQPAPDANAPLNAATAEAYHEAVQNLKNQLEQTSDLAKQNADAADLEKTVIRYDKDTSYRDLKGKDVVKFAVSLQQPLEKLITDLQSQGQHVQRTEVVKTPDLDETPAAYRPAVSDYFEHVSRDYHPPAAAPANPKP